MTLVDKHALTAALAERDAARAEVARLRAAVLKALPSPLIEVGEAARLVCEDVRAALAATEDQP